MNILFLIVIVISTYFMLCPQDAYSRFGVSFRNQIKTLIGTFTIYAIINLTRVIVGTIAGVFPGFALVMLTVNILLVRYHIKQIN